MKLNHRVTKPETRSVLDFNEDDVRQAMIDYAIKNGYKIYSENCIIYFPTPSPYLRDEERKLSLCAVMENTNEYGITNERQ